jgi:hypothetical protein
MAIDYRYYTGVTKSITNKDTKLLVKLMILCGNLYGIYKYDRSHGWVSLNGLYLQEFRGR